MGLVCVCVGSRRYGGWWTTFCICANRAVSAISRSPSKKRYACACCVTQRWGQGTQGLFFSSCGDLDLLDGLPQPVSAQRAGAGPAAAAAARSGRAHSFAVRRYCKEYMGESGEANAFEGMVVGKHLRRCCSPSCKGVRCRRVWLPPESVRAPHYRWGIGRLWWMWGWSLNSAKSSKKVRV